MLWGGSGVRVMLSRPAVTVSRGNSAAARRERSSAEYQGQFAQSQGIRVVSARVIAAVAALGIVAMSAAALAHEAPTSPGTLYDIRHLCAHGRKDEIGWAAQTDRRSQPQVR